MTIISTTHYPREPLSLPAIHAHWKATLSLPPTAQLSSLRRLVRAVTKDFHPALRPLSLAALCPLYLDLALAYAFLGEYYLASKVFQEAVDNDRTSAFGWFGLGLAQSELGEWRNARRSWKECLRCFGPIGDQQDRIHYTLFKAQDERPLVTRLDSTTEWALVRTKVEFNFRVALREKGSRKLGLAPRAADQTRPGLHGIPAGLRFGPGWDALSHTLDSPPPPAPPHPEEKPATRSPSSSSRTSRISPKEEKPLPKLPPTPSPSPFPANRRRSSDYKPPQDQDPFTSSSTARDVPVPNIFAAVFPQLQIQTDKFVQSPPYRKESIPPEPDHISHQSSSSSSSITKQHNLNLLTNINTNTIQNQTQNSQSNNNHHHHHHHRATAKEREDEGDPSLITPVKTHPDLDPDPDTGVQILQPRIFEGFGPSPHTTSHRPASQQPSKQASKGACWSEI